jgi:hypothetical protein
MGIKQPDRCCVFISEIDIFAGLILCELKIASDGRKTNQANA